MQKAPAKTAKSVGAKIALAAAKRKAAAPRPDDLRFSESPLNKMTAEPEPQCQPESPASTANGDSPSYPPRSAKAMALGVPEPKKGKAAAKDDGAADPAMPEPKPYIDERLTNWSTDLNWKNTPVPPLSTAKKARQNSAGGYLVSFMALAALFVVLVWSNDFKQPNRNPGADVAETTPAPGPQAGAMIEPTMGQRGETGPNGLPPLFGQPQKGQPGQDGKLAGGPTDDSRMQSSRTTSDDADRHPPVVAFAPPAADPAPVRTRKTYEIYPGEKLHVPQVAARGDGKSDDMKTDAKTSTISVDDLAEIETLLGKLALDPGQPDGILDDQSEDAIRLYQEMAGLHVDGTVSQDLLADLREVVRLYEQ